MIFLCTDFGYEGPYLGQMKALAASKVATCPVIDLIHDLPKFNFKAASYFIAAILIAMTRATGTIKNRYQ